MAAKRRLQLANELARFAQQYARKARSQEPNDRQYDRKLEAKMRRISPSVLSGLLTDDPEDDIDPIRKADDERISRRS
ncbi:hypothetical protein CIW54_02115 [Paraburkholderia sp. T12-10]|nr:hypothetical protein CIW54_02115 [Paraburkholderia sp. T12-10]